MTRQQLQRRIGKDIDNARWRYSGNAFHSSGSYRLLDDLIVCAEYTCDLTGITVELTRTSFMPLRTEVISVERYATAAACVAGTAERLLSIQEVVDKRIAPYRANRELYFERLNKPINLCKRE